MKNILINCIIIVFALNCGFYSNDKNINSKSIRVPVRGILFTRQDVKVYNGGFGSSIAIDPADPDYFYILTDRGPCVNAEENDTKIFVVPTFTPHIGKFKLENDSLKLVSVIELKDQHGNNLTGLPVGNSFDNEERVLINLNGYVLENDSLGIDPEGLVVLPDHSFWVSEEYGPSLIHFDSTGRTIERINPFSPGERTLPKVFFRHQANSGMEGLTITPDGKTLVGIMQSPLYNPSKGDVNNSLVSRILFFDLETGLTKQYIYLLEETNTNNCEIAAITDTTFLVLERDGDFLFGDPKALHKSVYKININGATDVSDLNNSSYGKLIKGKTIEELEDYTTLVSKGINPVKKTLICKLVDSSYTHDKPEGLAIINNKMIAISNDDDFGINSAKNNSIKSKKVPLENSMNYIDFNEILFIPLKEPLLGDPTSVEENSSLIPGLFELKQNYPNPFNPLTVISYRLSVIRFVTLKVYDLLGREVTALVNKEQFPGNYDVEFIANDLPSGTYFYKLQAGDNTEIRKMILLK